jgi:MFS family permease
MQDDLHMSDVEWSAGISLFYVGYIISQVPANVIIAKGQPRYIMPAIMLAWSAVTICMSALSTGWGFMLCRFLVGVTEGPFVPAVSLMTSSWYTKHESPLRMGIWHAGNIVSNIISGLLAAGILTNMDGTAGLASWKWFVLIEGQSSDVPDVRLVLFSWSKADPNRLVGAVSILVALSGFWLLPNFPNNTGTFFMSAEEAEMAQYRQLVSAGGISEDDEGDMWGGVWQACKDPYTWMFSTMHFALIIAQSFKDFFPSVGIMTSSRRVQESDPDPPTDCRHARLFKSRHISYPGSSIRSGILCDSCRFLVFRSYARALLAYRGVHYGMSRRRSAHDINSECWRSILWPCLALLRPFCGSQCQYRSPLPRLHN